MQRRQVGPSPAALGAALRSIISDAGRYQEDVAHAAGIPTRTFMRYLAGDSAMPVSAMLATADALDMTPGDLADAITAALGRTDRPTDRPTDPSQRNRRAQASKGQLEPSARSGDSLLSAATDALRAMGATEQDVTEALRHVTGSADGVDQGSRGTVSRRRKAAR